MNDQNSAGPVGAKRALLSSACGAGAGATAVRRRCARAVRASRRRCRPSQEQLWYFSQLAPDNAGVQRGGHHPQGGPFDVVAFARAFNEVVRRHDSWHSTFEVIDGVPMQRASSRPTYELPVVDLQRHAHEERENAAGDGAAVEDSRRPYDLARGPLMRPRLVRFDDDHHRLYLSLHHLIFDGVTLYRVVLPELITLYDAFARR